MGIVKKNKILFSKLSLHLLAKILLISGLFTLIITVLQLIFDYQNEIEQLNQKMDMVKTAQSASMATILWDFNESVINQQLQGIISIEGIAFAYIKTSFGKEYEAGVQPKNTALRREFDLNYHHNLIGKAILVANPQVVQQKVLDKFYLVLISQAVKTFFVSFFILLLIHRAVITHIVQMAHWLHSFNTNSPFQPLLFETNNNDEIAMLKVAVNDMGSQVHKHAVSLENMVEQRTTELQKRTNDLEQTQLELHKLLEEKDKALEHVSESVTDWLWSLDPFGNVVSVSEEFIACLGIKDAQLFVQQLPLDIDERANTKAKDELVKAFKSYQPFETIQFKLNMLNGEKVYLTLSGKPYYAESGEFQGYRGIAQNVTHQRYLEKLAYTDSLTGVANRMAFFQQTEKEINRSRRLSYDVGLMMLDLDHFKQINDTCGHDAGDKVLKAVASSLEACLREQDTLGRLGGEEFAIIVPGADKNGLFNLANRLLEAVRQLTFVFLAQDRGISVSIGYTVLKLNEDVSTALKRADNHLYQAKSSGRDKFCTDPEYICKIAK
ncbi:diguanylate cyclase [Thalassotalea sp. G2M2-11]|uniref:diguanylate cyclase domain-containing protein n=1 Tax=Thalassotalea sp. G2M2-11 TaxID=2787627 RepID=UPI0019D17A37|nr:diguanylate cyclase [Thalassotalea sp. G2M2-11]